MKYADLCLWVDHGMSVILDAEGDMLMQARYCRREESCCLENAAGQLLKTVDLGDDPYEDILWFLREYRDLIPVKVEISPGEGGRAAERLVGRVEAISLCARNVRAWPFLEEDKKQTDFLDKKNKLKIQEMPYLAELYGRVREKGGTGIVLQYENPKFVERFLEKPRFFGPGYARDLEPWPGKPNHCHENAAEIWCEHGQKNVRIVSGYAASTDGTWRQHSWVWSAVKRQVVETTTHRVAYFGLPLNAEEAWAFAKHNSAAIAAEERD